MSKVAVKGEVNSLPKNWVLTQIQDVCEINPRVDKKLIADDLKVSFVRMSAVKAESGEIDVSEEKFFSEVKKGFTSFLERDVLFAKITPCMENGKMAVVPNVINGYGFGSTEFHVLRAGEAVDAKYLYYFVSNRNFRGHAQHNMSGAVGQKRVPTNYLKEHYIPLAPLEQQKRIVAKIEELFSHIDAGIAALNQAKKLLKQYRQSVLKAAVTGELTKQWREENKDKLEPASQLLDRILKERRQKWEAQQLEQFKAKGKVPKDDKWKGKYKERQLPSTEELPEIPSIWKWVELQHVFDVITDGDHQAPPRADEGIPFLVIGDVNKGVINFRDKRFVPRSYYEGLAEIRRPRKGDLLYTVVGSFGIPVKIESDKEFCVQRHIAILKLNKRLSLDYVFHILSSGFIFRQATEVATGTAQKTVPLGGLREIKIPLMSELEQKRICEVVNEKLAALARVEMEIVRQLLKVEQNKQSILASAFNGDLIDD